MKTGAYKPTQTHRGTLQALRVWQARLRAISEALQKNARDEARARLKDLHDSVRLDTFPEFADNLLWLYRSVEAHLDAGKVPEAIAILDSLHGLLEKASARLHEQRSSTPPFV